MKALLMSFDFMYILKLLELVSFNKMLYKVKGSDLAGIDIELGMYIHIEGMQRKVSYKSQVLKHWSNAVTFCRCEFLLTSYPVNISCLENAILLCLILVCFDVLYPSQQFFGHVRMIPCLPGINQYFAAVKVTCSRTQHNDSAGAEFRASKPSIPNLTLYQLSHCAPLLCLL